MFVTPPPTTTVEIVVQNVRNAHGHVHVDLCQQSEFLKDCSLSGSVPAQAGTVIVRIANVPPGHYAAQAFHDENDNHKVDYKLFGSIPKEGVGFSNDAKIKFGPPKFQEAAFAHGAARQQISFSLRYF
ncbi:uncharacterized protein (DUF2141 family) [Sphingomonas vulcanisoli]|uniref:Uncharacterized protein (DUF2141 family) n=1 Tax=Sphingomonas vulcanisoli TaxID=1658060 RepID=A0ABX0TQG9_9SPHN|nr:DUF2141 domain-containing protein [Sphingomonas vulcanisoli]NIJ07768.1 uncharacterized protein (DUF2141 family) [Sphingomonas vulcanisoli]